MKPLNFIKPADLRMQQSIDQWYRFSKIVIGLIFCIIIIIQIKELIYFFRIKETYMHVQKNREQLNQIIQKKDILNKRLEIAKSKLKKLDTAQTLPHELMAHLAELLPINNCLTEFIYSYKNKSILKGQAKNNKSFTLFLNRLSQSDKISAIELIRTDKNDQSNDLMYEIEIATTVNKNSCNN